MLVCKRDVQVRIPEKHREAIGKRAVGSDRHADGLVDRDGRVVGAQLVAVQVERVARLHDIEVAVPDCDGSCRERGGGNRQCGDCVCAGGDAERN